MTLDWLDRAFVARKTTVAATSAPRARPVDAAVPASPSRPVGPSPAGTTAVVVAHSEDPIVGRLLDSAPTEWDALADAIEAAAVIGRRVVAFTGGARGEGRSTVVAGVATVLRGRGLSVVSTRQAPLLLPIAEAAAARAADVVLVDAGAWFTTGPVRRRAVEQAALGCDGVVIVRRADAPPCPPWSTALEALGLTVLGEALTFDRQHVAA
jgi:hypothetical protein